MSYIKINVEDVDRLASLSESQLKVWLYYKRRIGVNGKAWGKAATIAAWSNLQPGTIRNARSWLVKNGWMKKHDETSKCGLPMFVAVIPELQMSSTNDTETPIECHSQMTGGVIPELQGVSFENETEVTTVEEATDEAFRPPDGKNEITKETTPTLASLATAVDGLQASEEELHLQTLWELHGCEPFRYLLNDDGTMAWDEVRLVRDLIDIHGYDEVWHNLSQTFICPKTCGIAWRDFHFWTKQYDLTKRTILAWERKRESKQIQRGATQ